MRFAHVATTYLVLITMAVACDTAASVADSDEPVPSDSDTAAEDTDPVPQGCDVFVPDGADDATIRRKVANGRTPSVVCFDAGDFELLDRLDVPRWTSLVGAGRDQTTVRFAPTAGGDFGLYVHNGPATITDMTIRDAPGNAIHAEGFSDLLLERLEIEWSSPANGSGIYTWFGSDVVIRDVIVHGSREAGIYLYGEYQTVLDDVEVFDNTVGLRIEEGGVGSPVTALSAHDNTVGVLLVSLPRSPSVALDDITLRDAVIADNNRPNDAVHGVSITEDLPSGSGIILLAAHGVDIEGGTVSGNGTYGVLIASYQDYWLPDIGDVNGYRPDSEGNSVQNVVFTDNGRDPVGILADAVSIRPIPDIVWDGCPAGSVTNCVHGNAGTWMNLDLCGGFANPSTDSSPFECTE